jgi:putative ubiquitin-RnfH superfamily antitoxin RatB of RatAB toxin-antitoxin module
VELSGTLSIEVACAGAGAPVIVALEVPPGTTLRQAIERSGVLRRCPGSELSGCGVGVYGVARGLDEAVAAGDRVEVYRALPQDPKERRRRAARRGAGGG